MVPSTPTERETPMSNNLVNKLPSHQDVSDFLKEIQKLRSSNLGRVLVELTLDARKRALKFRPGGDRIVKIVGDIADQEGFSLPRIPVADMRKDLELVIRLQPIAEAMTNFARAISDTSLA